MLETLLCSAVISISSALGIAQPPSLAAVVASNDAKHPTIVHVVSRNHTVTVKASRGGMLYTVTENDGKTLLADASAETFARLQPELFKQLRQATASASSDDAPIAIGSIAE